MVNSSRRRFLRSAPLAAAAVGLPLTDHALLGQPTAAPEPFKLVTATNLGDAMKTLAEKPGNDTLFESKTLPFSVVLTTEEKKAAKEFEYHEGRDHIFLVIDGATLYEVGGTPQTPRNTKPGEWLAPASQGATTITMRRGDMLILPRNTPHKRTTETSVTFYLISTVGLPTP